MKTLIIAIAMVLLPLFTMIGVGATEFTINTTEQRYIGEIISSDSTFKIVDARITTSGSNASANPGSANSPIDITVADPLINANSISAGHFIYLLRIEEVNGNSAPAGSKWMVRLFLNDNQVGNEVYIGNISSDNNVEGARIRWNLGNTFNGGIIEVQMIRLQ
jgi:hypothetical protein